MSNAFIELGFNEDPPELKLSEPSRELYVELVPSSSWGQNLRKVLSRADWDKLRRRSYRAAGFLCEICGGKGRRHPIECHEVWAYDDEGHIQTLVRLEALCPACHEVKHFGRAEATGKGQRALLHLQRVNGWTHEQAIDHLKAAFGSWEWRSSKRWTLNLTWLEQQGVVLPDAS